MSNHDANIKDDYQQAVALAKQGKFERARSLLIAHDHPKTNALLDKVNAAIATRSEVAPQAKQVNPILRFISAVIVFTVSLVVSGFAASAMYNFQYNHLVQMSSFGVRVDYSAADRWMWGTFISFFVLLMFIGFRISQAILQRG